MQCDFALSGRGLLCPAGTRPLADAPYTDRDAALAGRPRGPKLECRVVAVNEAGEGEPSNTVTAAAADIEPANVKSEDPVLRKRPLRTLAVSGGTNRRYHPF
jgi:hypothetical protein